MRAPLTIVKYQQLEKIKSDFKKAIEINVVATAFIKEIENGNLDAIFPENVDKEEELTKALLAMQHQLQKIAEEEKQRNWTVQGLAKFGEILRTESDNSDKFYQKIISNLVKYVDSNQGGLFLVKENENVDTVIELVASYAYGREKFLKKQISPGEGLLGQCYLEKETIVMTDIPVDYIQITSGLGTANPNCLVIVPLIVNEEVQGLVELAGFKPLKPYQIEFLKKLGESIGSSLSNLKINYRTKKLLEETQAQAEQMRAQEEELRQNMEELGATQEEMRRVGAEMEGQLIAINNTMATIEFDLEGHILKANNNFLQLMEYTFNEVEGKHHRIFVEDNERKSDEYQKFWEELRQGKSVTGEFRRITRSGKAVYIKGIYNPLLDLSGKPSKVLKLAYDITGSKELELQIKQQLEETLAQEEELRQNMEELGATQEEMARVSAEMESQLSAINKTLATIEFDLEGNIISANDNFLSLMGYQLEEIKGKHHKIFVEESEKTQKSYIQFWKNLAEGQSKIGEFKRIAKSGRVVFIKGVYNPVFDQKGNPVRIFKIAYDITESKARELQYSKK